MERRKGRAGRSKEQPVRATGKWGGKGEGWGQLSGGPALLLFLYWPWAEGCGGTVSAEHWVSAASPHHWGHLGGIS